MTNRKIDADTVKALNLLRLAMAGAYHLPQEVREALRNLDNADVFREVDETSDVLAVRALVTKEVFDWLTSDDERFAAAVQDAVDLGTFRLKMDLLFADDHNFYPESGEFSETDMESLLRKVVTEAQRRDLV